MVMANIYGIVVTWARVNCLIYMHDALGHCAPSGECGYIRQIMSAHVTTVM